MKLLPIELQAKTAANDFIILEITTGDGFQGEVALPASWLAKDPSKYDVLAEGLSASVAKGRVGILGLFLAPGSMKSSLDRIGDLHTDVGDVYTLVDEGYVDGRKAILAFR